MSTTATGTSQQFCVRWNSHLGSLGAAFPQLLAGQRFVDVTLACEGHQLHCHRLVLAACSTYFESLLGENPCKHPIIILPRDIKLWEIQALVDFMYKGEVNVSQAGLSDLLKCAEILQIRGLCGSDAALNLNHVNSTAAATTSSPAASSATPVPSTGVVSQTPFNHINHSTEDDSLSTNSNTLQLATPNTKVNPEIIDSTGNLNSSNEKSFITSQNDSNSLLRNVKNEQQLRTSPPNRVVEKMEPIEGSMDDDMDDGDSHDISNDKTDDDSYAAKYADYLESAKNENHQHHHLSQTQQQQQQHEIDQSQSTENTTASRSLYSKSRISSTVTNSNDTNLFYDQINNIYVTTIDNDEYSNSLPRKTYQIDSRSGNSFRGKIRVKSNENLFDNFKSSPSIKTTKTLRSQTRSQNRNNLPGTLRFNRNSMTVYLKPSNNQNCQKQTATTRSTSPAGQETNNFDDRQSSSFDETIDETAVEIKTEIDITDDSNYENIVCLPNVMEMYNDDEPDGDEDENRYRFSGVSNDFDTEMMYTNGRSPTALLKYATDSETPSLTDDHIKTIEHNLNGIQIFDVNGRSVELSMAQFISDHTAQYSRKQYRGQNSIENYRGRYLNSRIDANSTGGSLTKTIAATATTVAADGDGGGGGSDDLQPTLSAVVLRNPRSNQPRTYSNDALYAALMDVKGGESIYRASQIHKVPRKTLRNWMKRWHIKSAYPMPRQLKQAAEKKKRIQQLMENGGGSGGDGGNTTNVITNFNTLPSDIGNITNDHDANNMLQQSCSRKQKSIMNLSKIIDDNRRSLDI